MYCFVLIIEVGSVKCRFTCQCSKDEMVVILSDLNEVDSQSVWDHSCLFFICQYDEETFTWNVSKMWFFNKNVNIWVLNTQIISSQPSQRAHVLHLMIKYIGLVVMMRSIKCSADFIPGLKSHLKRRQYFF